MLAVNSRLEEIGAKWYRCDFLSFIDQQKKYFYFFFIIYSSNVILFQQCCWFGIINY